MDKTDPNVPPEWTLESYWQSFIDDARTGSSTTRNLMYACIRFLKGIGFTETPGAWDKRIPIDKKTGYAPRGYVPEPLCSFMIDTLEAAMSAKKEEVGDAMGMGKLHKGPANARELYEFIAHYSAHVGGNYPVTKELHVATLRSIKNEMGCTLRTVQRYWKHFERAANEFGLPSAKGCSKKYKLEKFADIITHYRSQMSAPVHVDSVTPAAAHEKALIEVASRTRIRLDSMKHYWKVFETALAEYDLIPVMDSQKKATFEDIVTFINHYVSIMNSLVDDNSIMLEVEHDNILDKIIPLMNSDCYSVSRYWDIINNTIEDFYSY